MPTSHRVAASVAALLALVAALPVPSVASDWRAHAQRRYFLVNGDDWRETTRATFATYRSSCVGFEIKEYEALNRINYICEM